MTTAIHWAKDLNSIEYHKDNNRYLSELKSFYYSHLERTKKDISASGRLTCNRISRIAEAIIVKIYHDILNAYQYHPECAAAVSVGGFGRRELNPYSDIDILFLQNKKMEKESNEFITRILYILWDMKLRLGQSCRTVKNCIKAAEEDITFKTSITSHRFLTGNENLYEDFVEAQEEIFGKNILGYYNILIPEEKQGVFDLGNSVLIKEPNVKESQGGLRSVHTVLWLARSFYGTSTLKELLKKGFIQRSEYVSLMKSYDYLLLIRNYLHFEFDRKQDILTNELQEKIVHTYFNLAHERHLRKNVESFMRNYYRHSKNIYLITLSQLERIKQTAEEKKVLPKPKQRVFIDENFIKILDKLYLRRQIEPDLKILMQIFYITVQDRVSYSGEIQNYIHSCLPLIDENTRHNTDVFNIFRKVLKNTRNVYYTLSMMHATGFLNKYIPYFQKMDCTAQHDYYHKYTLDEHHLQCIKQLELLYHSDAKNLQHYKNALYSIGNMDILYFALLTHDYGKIWSGDHVENARKTLDTLIEPFPFTTEEKVLIAFLILNHLKMSRTSQRVDFNEIKTLAAFAELMGSTERLTLLMLFTYADINAVGEGVFNNWKSSLLLELYFKASVLLKEADNDKRKYVALRDEEIAEIRRKLLSKVENMEELSRYIDSLPSEYLINVEESEILQHYEINRTRKIGEVCFDYKEQKDYYTVYVITEEAHGLFARICGVFLANGLDILNADLYTGSLVVDRFSVAHRYDGPIEESKWKRIEKEMNRMIAGEIEDLGKLINERMAKVYYKSKTTVVVKPKIHFEISPHGYTMVSFECRDQMGLLYRFSSAIAKLGFSIYSAKINTYGIRVFDTFYIRSQNNSVLNSDELFELENAFYELMQS